MINQKLLAWSVHLYTALGLVAAAGMAVSITRGGDDGFRWAIALMIVATFIDATDGTLARRWRVKEVLPGFEGRRLDDIVDFQTYTSLPMFFIWRAGILPGDLNWWLLLPLLASAYGFAQTESKTEDHFFLGFPSYWNVIAMYLYWLQLPVWLSLGLIVTFALLTFVPSLYLYPSYSGPYSNLTRIFCAIWAVALVLIIAKVFNHPQPVIRASLAFPVFYFGLSWWITLRRWMSKERAPARSSYGATGMAAETEE